MISKETNFWKHDIRAHLYCVGICENNTGGGGGSRLFQIKRV